MLTRVAILALLTAPVAGQNRVLYASDFEADNGGFAPIAPADWEHGVPTSGPGGAHSGTRCWGTRLDGPPIPFATHRMRSPVIDASSATGADALLVSWWQYFDDVGTYSGYAFASGGASQQTAFGRRIVPGSTDLPHVGWRRMTALLGPSFATSTLTVEFRFSGSGTDGYYVDDFRVEVVESVTVVSEDLETGTGGFQAQGSWQRGAPMRCPLPAAPASGAFCLGTTLAFCGYPFNANDALISPVLDLSPYANRREVYLRWKRYASLEFLADGVHHEISLDGGATWELASGYHHGASGPALFSWVGFGLAVDPAATPSVRLRWRLTSDGFETGYGMWLDDFELALPESIPGSGANPPGTLSVTGGTFAPGAQVSVAIDDPTQSFPTGATSLLVVSAQPDPGLPDGTPVPGWSLSTPGAAGDLLVSLGAGATLATIAGPAWSPGQPSVIQLNVPNDSSLIGLDVYLQGVLVDTSGPRARFGLTTGLYERIGS